jgi:SAM-dependent methyltransferase
MKNADAWRPTKYVLTPRGLRASDDPRHVGRGSRFIGDLLARTYETAIRDHARGRLLDLGCGEVPLYHVYRALVDETVCVDWALTPERQRHVDRVCDLNQGIPLPDEHFDTVLATDVLEHVSRPELLFGEMARVLRRRGKLILGVPFFYWIHEAPYDFHRYTEYQLRHFCSSNHLDVVSLESYGGTPEVLADISAKHLSRFRILSNVHLRACRVLSRSFLWHELSRATSRTFPLGYCLIAAKPDISADGTRRPEIPPAA